MGFVLKFKEVRCYSTLNKFGRREFMGNKRLERCFCFFFVLKNKANISCVSEISYFTKVIIVFKLLNLKKVEALKFSVGDLSSLTSVRRLIFWELINSP